MNDRAVSLFEKYGIDASKVRKGRGSLIATTPERQVMLVQYSGSPKHLQMEYEILHALKDIYNRPLDFIYQTEDEQLYCVDYEGKKYIVKDYVEGREADVYDPLDVHMAVDGLARLHVALREVEFEGKEELCSMPDQLMQDFEKKTRELLRARNYIRKLSDKDEFELKFLEYFDLFYQQTLLIADFLDKSCLENLNHQQIAHKMLIHGDCNHHNILLCGDGVAIVNFERIGAHLQVKDLYLYMRKVLEKNDWSYEVACNMLSAYQAVLPLTKEEKRYLYSRFLYPEKFWKVANGYLNQRKALPARRQLEKLIATLEIEEKRQLFLSKWLEICR